MLISVVTGTHNRLQHLQAMIASARADIWTLPYEIVVIDAGSNDGTLEWCKAQVDIRLIEHGERRGAIPAFTEGAYAARGKYVLLANDDILFHPGSILAATAHLDCVPTCGAVAFADNRPYPEANKRGHQVMPIWGALPDEQPHGFNYAQVGLFRKWLGDACDWWGANTGMKGARTYGGDAYLSAEIWTRGYSVDAVPLAKVDDVVLDDGLRAENNVSAKADSAMYTTKHNVVHVSPVQTVPNPDKRGLRILYCPVYEIGDATQHSQKHGLRDALSKVGAVVELDYIALGANLDSVMTRTVSAWQPDVLLTQAHGADRITPNLLATCRMTCPRMVVVNWNGDVWEHGLIAPPILELLRHVDLQLVVNSTALDTYAEHGVPAAYWQCAYEPVDETCLPDAPKFDVVFLGNNYGGSMRAEMMTAVTDLARDKGFSVGIFGENWEMIDPHAQRTTYNFAFNHAVYRNCKIALGNNQFQTKRGFISDRLFTVLSAGAFFLQQRVEGLKELTGITPGVHFVEWTDLDDLRFKLIYWLAPERDKERRMIAERGQRYVRSFHSFDARVRQLFDELLPQARRTGANLVLLEYQGRSQQAFGIVGAQTRTQYQFTPGFPLVVNALDATPMLADGQWKELTNGN